MVDEPLLEIDGVPTWLETPVTDVPPTSPPVQSRPQVLPLNELSWEHFERLCLRYVRSRASVVMTQLYGIRGQKQHGIDLYVRLTEPTLMNARLSWVTAALLFLVILTGSKLWAQGPPYQTDDPVPVDLHHYEFYIFGSADGTPVEMDSSGPAFEFNWGALPRVQVHAILPWGVAAPLNNPVYLPSGSGPTEFGLTDMELGVKIAFIKEGKYVPQIGSFTMFEMPTGNADKGLGVGKVWYKLPIWLQKNVGAWTFDGGAGYEVVPQTGYRNFFYTGWLVKKKLNDRLELGAEVFAHGREGIAAPQTEASTLVDVGGYYHFKQHPGQQFLFCYGHSVAGQTENYAYVGMYWTWGKDKDDKKEGPNKGYVPKQLNGSTF